MYRFVFLLALSVSFSQAIAADFRGANFGDSCGSERGYEDENNSKLIREAPYSGIEYEGVHMGSPAFIYYQCDRDNQINRGMVLYRFDNHDAVKSFYSEIKPLLMEAYGEPALDGESPAKLEQLKAQGLKMSDESKYSAHWDYGSIRVMLNTALPGLKKSSSVGISYLPIDSQ